jgi:hypothetical protein
LRKRYADAEFTSAFNKTMQIVNAGDEKRKKAGAAIRQKWQDPAYLEKMKNRKAPDKKKTSATMKTKWQDPIFREKMKNRKRKGWKQNETNQN